LVWESVIKNIEDRREQRMKYCTQMETAKKGLITKEMRQVAAEEGMLLELLTERVSEGE